jgi:hypothetical protein
LTTALLPPFKGLEQTFFESDGGLITQH